MFFGSGKVQLWETWEGVTKITNREGQEGEGQGRIVKSICRRKVLRLMITILTVVTYIES